MCRHIFKFSARTDIQKFRQSSSLFVVCSSLRPRDPCSSNITIVHKNIPGQVESDVVRIRVFARRAQYRFGSDHGFDPVRKKMRVEIFLQRNLQVGGRARVRYANAEFHLVPVRFVVSVDELKKYRIAVI